MFDYQRLDRPLILGKEYFFPRNDHPALGSIPEVRVWCTEEFGRPGIGQVTRWYNHLDLFWFRDAADASLFRMRWC